MTPFTLNIKGNLKRFEHPLVMGIINVTPDSFYAPSRTSGSEVTQKVEKMLDEGVDIIDLGAYSSRPGADDVPIDVEISRLEVALKQIRALSNTILISVDTFRSEVARVAVEKFGADIINDISGGLLDDNMIPTVAELKAPYILMHMRGTPKTMQQMCDYPQGVTQGVIKELSERINIALKAGICDVIVDPGFGFSKTIRQNYELLRNLDVIAAAFNLPILVGVSRKSMFTRLFEITAEQSLPSTIAADSWALAHQASIIRVHDVAAARQCVDVYNNIVAR